METKIVSAIRNQAAFATHLRYEHRMADTHRYRLDYLVAMHDQDHAQGVKIHGSYPHILRKLH